jgi:N5-(cytidine 5'-diphosphoramidyl)-L-glutamine hydrolase
MPYKFGISMRVSTSIYGEKRDTIAQDWSNYMISAFPDSQWLFIPNIGRKAVEYFGAWGLNTLILSGGDDIGSFKVRDETELSLIRHALDNSIPIIGICRGLQLLHQFHGGIIQQGDENFVQLHRAKKHKIRLHNSTRLVNSFHVNTILEDTLHKDFKVFARCANDNTVEGFINRQIFAMMWHPEREIKPNAWNQLAIHQFLESHEKKSCHTCSG